MSYTVTKRNTNLSTGEYTEQVETIIKRNPNRDAFQFIKLFLRDLHLLRNLSSGSYKVAFELLFKMNYDNQVMVNQEIRREIAGHCKCSENRVAQIIGELVDNDILIRHSKGLYYFNPLIFGKGSAKTIQEMRVRLLYNKDGRKEEIESVRTK